MSGIKNTPPEFVQSFMTNQYSVNEQRKKIMPQNKVYKPNNHKNLNIMKREMAAMLPGLERYEAKKKEDEEAAKLDMEIQAKVKAYKEEYYKNLRG